MSGEPRISLALERKIHALYVVQNLTALVVSQMLNLTGRGVVTGIATRRGWKKTPEAVKLNRLSNEGAKAAVAKVAAQKGRDRAAQPRPVPIPIPASPRPAMASSDAVLALTPYCCRWPLGDPSRSDFHFCGQRKEIGLSYCAEHVRAAAGERSDKRHMRLERLS